jgi:hypothetical protein
MIDKRLSGKGNSSPQGATALGPGDFPLGSPESRVAARLRLQRVGVGGELPSDCICFPEKEQPFFCFPWEEDVAAKVKCPLHGDRFPQPVYVIYVSKWRREKEPARRQRLSPQYQKAWNASFPPELWPAEEEMEGGKLFLRLKDGTRLLAYE